MSYVCEHCAKRLGIHRATAYATMEEVEEHMTECHPTSVEVTSESISEALTGNPTPGTPVPVEVPLQKLVDELLDYARQRAVPGPSGEDYRNLLVKARELGLLRR